MADLDTGHIFLTTMAPIKASSPGDDTHTSYEQKTREALAKLSTALQSPATVETDVNSPFARNLRTHLARMFVMDDVIYNGRVGKNAIVTSITGDDPVNTEDVDRLNCAYLVFCADIDAIVEDGDPLPNDLNYHELRDVRLSYARKLWDTMEPELREIYSNCVGFEGIETASAFAEFLDKCHIETTMPFHDYFIEEPRFNHLPAPVLMIAVGIPLVLTLLALFLAIVGADKMPIGGLTPFWSLLLGLVVTPMVAYVAIQYANANGAKPIPPGKYDDLPSVLKSLYMQQKFSDFVVENQGSTARDLHKSFGAFLAATKPSDTSGPTQPPGVISSADIEPRT